MAKTASDIGKSSNAKGKAAEREVLAMLRPIIDRAYFTMDKHGWDVGEPPRLQRNTLQADKGGADAIGLHWLALEIKHCAVLDLANWWKQCVYQAGTVLIPVLVYKRTGAKWRVRMRGYLHVGRYDSKDVHSEHIVDIGLLDFLTWFEKRCMYELSLKSQLKQKIVG